MTWYRYDPFTDTLIEKDENTIRCDYASLIAGVQVEAKKVTDKKKNIPITCARVKNPNKRTSYDICCELLMWANRIHNHGLRVKFTCSRSDKEIEQMSRASKTYIAKKKGGTI